MAKINIRHPYDGVRYRVGSDFSGKGRTKQSFKAECDINAIMAKYQKTGAIEHGNLFAGEYGFASSVDFQQAMEIIRHAEDLFSGLPSSVRSRFDHDPGQFLDFVQDPANLDEMRVLGLAVPKPPEAAKAAPAASEAVSSPPAKG